MLWVCASESRRQWVVNPIGNEQVEFARLRGIAAGRPDELRAVAREHRKRVEVGVVRDALRRRARIALVDEKQVERVAVRVRVRVVGREDYAVRVWVVVRRPVGAAKRRELPHVAAVHVDGEELHQRRRHEARVAQVDVYLLLLLLRRVIRPEQQSLAVR